MSKPAKPAAFKPVPQAPATAPQVRAAFKHVHKLAEEELQATDGSLMPPGGAYVSDNFTGERVHEWYGTDDVEGFVVTAPRMFQPHWRVMFKATPWGASFPATYTDAQVRAAAETLRNMLNLRRGRPEDLRRKMREEKEKK